MRLKVGAVLVLILCLGTALAISETDEDESGKVVGAIDKGVNVRAEKAVTADSAAARFDLQTLKRRAPKVLHDNTMFVSKSWYVPPAVPVQQAVNLPPPPPSAPPQPFTYTGRIINGGEVILFLGRNGHQHTVKKGDVVEETYRIDEITPTEVGIMHLPTSTRQVLPLGAAAVGGSSSSSLEHAASEISPVSALRAPLQLVPNIGH